MQGCRIVSSFSFSLSPLKCSKFMKMAIVSNYPCSLPSFVQLNNNYGHLSLSSLKSCQFNSKIFYSRDILVTILYILNI